MDRGIRGVDDLDRLALSDGWPGTYKLGLFSMSNITYITFQWRYYLNLGAEALQPMLLTTRTVGGLASRRP